MKRADKITIICACIAVSPLYLTPLASVASSYIEHQDKPAACIQVRADAQKLAIQSKNVWVNLASDDDDEVRCKVNEYMKSIGATIK